MTRVNAYTKDLPKSTKYRIVVQVLINYFTFLRSNLKSRTFYVDTWRILKYTDRRLYTVVNGKSLTSTMSIIFDYLEDLGLLKKVKYRWNSKKKGRIYEGKKEDIDIILKVLNCLLHRL